MNVLNIFVINDYIACILSITLNAILLYISTTIKMETLRGFRNFIIFCCSIDIFFACISGITQMHFIVHNGAMIITSSGPFANIPKLSKGLLVVNDSLFLLVVLIIPSNFVYRYIQLCKNSSFELKHGITIILLVTFGWGIYFSSIVAVMAHGVSFENEFGQYITSNLPFKLEKITFFGGYMHNIDLQIVVISAVIQITLSYIIIAYCIFGIIKYLRKNQSQFSLGKLRIQNQVTKALLGQALTPFFLFVLPLTIIAFCGMAQFNCGQFRPIISGMLNWIPVCNTLSTLIFVVPFRKRAIQVFRLKTIISTYTESRNHVSTNNNNRIHSVLNL